VPAAEQLHVPPPVSRWLRGFAPSAGFTVLALLAAALFVRLGFWQWQRGIDREAQWARFRQGAAQLIDPGTRDLAQLPLYQRVSVSGRLDAAHQFLLDNRSWQGRAGYEVLTPLTRGGTATLIVDRGWVPFTGTRAQLPDISLVAGPAVTLTGRLGALPSPGLASGRAAPDPTTPWPKLTSFPDLAQLQAALGTPLAPRILLLDPGAPLGYVRDWPPPGLPPLRHFSYAIQWWSFAVLALVMWALASRRPAPPGVRP
jgi:surfeit locus 1 family protein